MYSFCSLNLVPKKFQAVPHSDNARPENWERMHMQEACVCVMHLTPGSFELWQASGVGTYEQLRAAVQRQLQQKFRP